MPFPNPLFRHMAYPQNPKGVETPHKTDPQKTKWSIEAADASDYIAQMTAELAIMAKSAQLDLLAYFLEMAQIEAQAQAYALKPELTDVTPQK